MQISEGIFSYQDVSVVAVRGPKDGVYCCVYSQKYNLKEELYEAPVVKGFVGIGCAGYVGSRWVGVSKRELTFLKKNLLCKTITYPSIVDEKVKIKHNVYDIPEIFQELDLSKGARFNQGDAYFAVNLGTPLQASEPGNASEPIMNTVVEKIFPKKK